MAIIGYARTSTREQEAGLQAQIRDLIAAGCAARALTLKILDPAMTIQPPAHANGSMAGAMSRMILTVMAAMAQLEREIMLERQREGIARAKAEGKYKGQPPHARAKAPQVIELAAADRTRNEIAAALEISERSVYRILAETRPQAT